jgi:cytochrome c biogenesis protein CcmG/thiol:disulfide interchange protein DsbE
MKRASLFVAVGLIAIVGVLWAFRSSWMREAPEEQAPPPIQLAQAPAPAAQDQTSVQAPDFRLTDVLKGKPVQLSSLKGQVVLVDFWATWCGPCRMEIPGFVELQKEFSGKGVKIIGVSLDQGSDVVKQYCRASKVNYHIVMGDGALAGAYGGVRAIPATFLIGKDGTILQQYVGFHEREAFEHDIREALSKA